MILGDPQVGKTTIVNRYAKNLKKLGTSYTPTIGVDFVHMKYRMKEGKTIPVHIWDSAG